MNFTSKCLHIFYDFIIKEACYGRIDSYFIYNVIFNTRVENVFFEAVSNDDDLLIPTLNIKNKEEFDRLLVSYVECCLNFYDDNNFPVEILNDSLCSDKMICKEKTIMALMFASATIDDFNDPILFLKRRIDFIKNDYCCIQKIGYSNILDCDLEIQIKKDIINNETPYQFVIIASSLDDSFVFPCVKFGISDNKLYVYAIQNSFDGDSSFAKKIKRKLYKVGSGFSSCLDNFTLFDDGNLNDVTPSFLMSANIFISYFNGLGFSDVLISSLLIERWNSKGTAGKVKFERGKINDLDYKLFKEKQNLIQNNLTQKFIRTFLRLVYHYDNIDVLSYPFLADSYLHLSVKSLDLCNNELLSEVRDLVKNSDFKSL